MTAKEWKKRHEIMQAKKKKLLAEKEALKIFAEEVQPFIEIYCTVKKHQERINAILNKTDDYAVDEIKKLCKRIDQLKKLKILSHSEEIKDLLITDFFQGMSYWHIKDNFGTKKLSITEAKNLDVKGKIGRPKSDYALDLLIYLLASKCGNDFKFIAKFLTTKLNDLYSRKRVENRFMRAKKDILIKHYAKFLDASRTTVVTTKGGPDTPCAIAVSWELPLNLFQ